jgi:hypothetical protein
MKTLDAVKIMDIAGTLIPLAMLAAIAILAIRFIRTYMGICIDCFTIYMQPFFMCAYARKRVVNRIIHDCKNAVFPINPDNGRGYPGGKKTNVSGYKGIQRGLLKDNPQHNYINIKFFFLFAIIKECMIVVKNQIIFKKAWLGALALFLMVGVATITFAFKGNTKANIAEKSIKVLAPQWYNLSATGATTANQIIGSLTSGNTKPNTPSCNDLNSGDPCAVQVNFSGTVPPFSAVNGKSVAYILANYSGSSVADATREP